MTYMNLDLKGPSARRGGASASVRKPQLLRGLMPTRIFVKLLFSTLAAVLAVHFWRQGGGR